MFATKLILPAIVAAVGFAFAAAPARADSYSIAVGGCRPPVVHCPPVYTPPVCTPAPVYRYSAPVVVYRPYVSTYYRSGWSHHRDHDRWDRRDGDRRDRDHDGRHDRH